jgi:hypothetical protein
MERTLIAFCVTRRCRALLRIDLNVVGNVFAFLAIHGDVRLLESASCMSLTGIRCILLINGTPPGVLFLVTLLCIHGVVFRACYEVELHACMIGGTSVMCVEW